jgi:hypothetical protein
MEMGVALEMVAELVVVMSVGKWLITDALGEKKNHVPIYSIGPISMV